MSIFDYALAVAAAGDYVAAWGKTVDAKRAHTFAIAGKAHHHGTGYASHHHVAIAAADGDLTAGY